MIELAQLPKRIGGAVDKILCETFDARACALPAGKYVSLCFDDFPQSSAHTAAPMIEQQGWRATWYVAGQFMGQTTPEFGKMFEASDLQMLRENGHDFGFHTHDHIDCRTADAAEIDAQMRMSEAFFKEHDIIARSFAYPFGAVSPSAKRQLAGANIGLRSIQAGINTDTIDLHMLKACGLQDDKGGTQRALR
ncbi:MAG: polysaccharide deacetylase family protein, partial [Pseudomonadota bacterium]